MKEEKNEKTYQAAEKGGTKFKKSTKALKDFKQTSGGVVYVQVKKGDDVSKLNDAKKSLLRQHGVI